MPLLLPNLDDRKWLDLVDEGRSLIPVYGPEWTDHSPSDPGIMLTELLALIAEMDIYQLNQISDRERLKFLKLVGVVPYPPSPAQAVLRILLTNGASALTLPAGLEFLANDPSSVATRYRTLQAVTLAPGSLDALQFNDGNTVQNLTPTWQRRGTMNPFGSNPKLGDEFYLGFSQALPVDTNVQTFLSFGSENSSQRERHRIYHELSSGTRDCQPPRNPCAVSPSDRPCNKHSAGERSGEGSPYLLQHYGVRLVWEFVSSTPAGLQWRTLHPEKKQVVDDTRAFTLDGSVNFRLPNAMISSRVGTVTAPLYYLRCRVVAGSWDAAPVLQDVAFNGIRVEQSVPDGMEFVIDPGAAIHYASSGPPKPGETALVKMTLNDKHKIVALDFNGDAETDPGFLVYDYREPKNGNAGLLFIEGVFLGFGNDFPNQQFAVPDAPEAQRSFHLYSLENNQWHTWRLGQDFDACTRKDFHATLDPSSGTLTFGDGEHGRVPPALRTNDTPPREQCLIFAKYQSTRAEAGNLAFGTVKWLADSPHNRALLYDPAAVPDGWTVAKSQLADIKNPVSALGGTAPETVAQASGRADQLAQSIDRAITLADYEKLALHTPGTQIARVSARANLHPSFPCFKAPGLITVIVLPSLPKGRPTPTPGLLQTVRAYLRRRRIIGTRVEVVAPTYLEVSIQAEVKALSGVNKVNLQKSVVQALNTFLDPLAGGPSGDGWPFGRDVYRSEIMRTIDEVPGVDYVATLALLGPDGQPRCGNVCLGPTWLVASGSHQISVL
jgi:hypothetical protein